MNGVMNKLANVLEYIPEDLPNNTSEMVKYELTDFDNEYFNDVITNTMIQGNYISYLDKNVRMHNTPYDTLIREPSWSKIMKAKFHTYIIQTYKEVTSFNMYIYKQKTAALVDVNATGISFVNEPNFPLVVSCVNKLNPQVYILDSPHEHKKITPLCSLHDYNAKRIIFNYLKLHAKLDCLKGVKSDTKVFGVFLDELSFDHHKIYQDPVPISNSHKEYCKAYIPLNFKAKYAPVAWHEFMSQFQTDTMQHQFMAWVYGIFVANDYDRRVLWLEGKAETAKTTASNAIEDFLNKYGDGLVGSLAKVEDKFSLTTVVNARLVVYADSKDYDFFSRRDVFNLTGKDTVYFEQKGKDPDSKRIFAKILITSNYPPVVNQKHDFETSRILHIKIDDKKATALKKNRSLGKLAFSKKLLTEMPSFLAECKQYYESFNREQY